MNVRLAVAAVLTIWSLAVAIVMLLPEPAAGAPRWPTPAELHRCEVPFHKMKDAKLRRWCLYWSRRLP